MIKLWGVLKGLLVQEESDRSKQLSLEVNSSATTATRTTLQSTQTGDRTITLPDADTVLTGNNNADTLTNKTIDGDDNTLIDIDLPSLKRQVADVNKFIVRDASGDVISSNSVPTSDVVGEDDSQTLTNKAIDADLNTITNIENTDIKAAAAIDATKIADGSVTNTEFQYINSLTSNAQTQLNAKQETSEKGQPGGYASLDGSGLVPAAQLPSYVDDVLEFADLASFPVTGETGKMYIALDTNNVYRWSGSVYVQVAANGANQFLSNLTSPTAINEHLLPGSPNARDIGSVGNEFRNIIAKEGLFGFSGQRGLVTAQDSSAGASAKLITEQDSPSGAENNSGIVVEGSPMVLAAIDATHAAYIETANNGSGDSGNISVQTGTASGTRGEISLDSRQVNANNTKIVNVADPTNPQDAATKAYADTSGGGSGSKNYLDSDSADLDLGVGNWATDDGAGGSASFLTLSSDTTTPLAGTGSLQVDKSAGDASGEFIKLLSQTIDRTDRGKQLFGSFAFNASAANFNSGDFILEIYDATNATVLYSGSSEELELLSTSGKFNFSTFTETTTASIEVRLKVNSTNASAYTLYFDEFRLGPSPSVETIYRKSATLDLSTDANFSAGEIQIERVGNMVTISSNIVAAFSSATVVSTATGFLPDWATAAGGLPINLTTFNGAIIQEVYVPSDGSLVFQFRNYSGTLTAQTSSQHFAITYNVPDLAGPTMTENDLGLQTIKAGVFLDNNQSVLTTDPTIVQLNNVSYDSHNSVDVINNRVNILKSGYYILAASINYASVTTDERLSITVQSNNIGPVINKLDRGDPTDGDADLGKIVYLERGDFIYITTQSVADTNYLIRGSADGSQTFLTIASLPDFTVLGAVKERNRVQTKILSADVTSDGAISDLTFSNLVIGKWYEVTGKMRLSNDASSSDSIVYVDVTHDSISIDRALFQINESSDTTVDTAILPVSSKFKATASSLTFVAVSASVNSRVEGSGSRVETYVQLEERNDLTETTDF